MSHPSFIGCPPPTGMASGVYRTQISPMRTDPSSRIFYFFLFDGPLGLRILNGFFACQDRVTFCSSLSTQGGLKSKNAHSPVNPRRAESPMASIAQGKRSDTLGKPPHHATPCKGKSKHKTLCFSTFALTGRNLHGNIIPRAPLRLPLGYELLPLQGVPVKCAS